MTELLPMLCHEAPKVGGKVVIPPGGDWIMERKLDGWRFLIYLTDEGQGVYGYAGRNGTDYTEKLPAALIDALEAVRQAAPDTVLDCELIAPGQSSPVVATGLASGGIDLELVVFDVVKLLGADTRSMAWRERRALLERLSVRFGGPVRLSATYEANQDMFEAWVAEGAEGAVCKRTGSLYRSGKRSRDWLKLKPQTSAEARIIGFKRGQGESNCNSIGAFRLQMLDTGAETSCAILDNAQEAEVTADPDAFLGRIVEIGHYGIDKRSGKPRHPVFHRWRPDRDRPLVAA